MSAKIVITEDVPPPPGFYDRTREHAEWDARHNGVPEADTVEFAPGSELVQ